MDLTFRQVNLQNTAEHAIILSLLNDFSLESVSKSLLPEVYTTLISNLQQHPTTVVYLAECEGQSIGIAVCFIGFSTFANKPLLNLHDFYISDAFQGRGAGKQFLNWIEQEAKARGCCKVTLEVSAHNTWAKILYERSGYHGSQQEPPENMIYALFKSL